MEDDSALVAAWVRQWRDAGPALAEQRRRELAELTPEQALRTTDALLSLATTTLWNADRRMSSGLVEQQADLPEAAASLNEVFGAALEVQKLCQSRSWKFCFIGAVAVQRWGEPRLTGESTLHS